MTYIPALPEGYTFSLAKRQNLLLGYHATQPVLYLDEDAMEWRVLDRAVGDITAKEPA